jgi:nucleotide-binding universal stress UspA family protein
MSYRTILLIASNEQHLRSQMHVAKSLAARSATHLVGLAVLPPRIVIPAGTPGTPDTVSIEFHRDKFRREAEHMRTLFESVAAESTKTSCDWILDDADDAPALSLIAAHCHAADLVIADRIDASAHGSCTLPERLIMRAGRPVLLVPRMSTQSEVGDRIIIAWNGAREASRAAFDAIPLLKAAKHVKILRVTVDTGPRRTHHLSAEKLCGTLARHHIRPEAEELLLSDSDVGPALLSAVKAENADLLVMGCYGHSRLREFVLGGATRHVLRHMTVPVLMSH